ncbi:MAG: nucleotidyl transferase AbiEii/AbiGii toxin family protein [Erysipelotrichaceae bacterium]|nr:nucleotidyl transferase AbiEii/AbiGii toxin family protein [Erysipelotrichaceae bacterium]
MTSAASVKARLRNRAESSGKSLQEVLTAYGLERTLYRVAVSGYNEKFTLKGGILLYALFDGEFARATRDIDLLGKNISNEAEDIRKVFEEIFSIECDDALRYDLSTLEVRNITEFKEYHGVNVSIMSYLDRTEVPVAIDIGFGDVIYPGRVGLDFPVLLNMDHPKIFAYPICSVLAEKLEAIVSLGNANSRYKDFYDIYVLANRFPLDGRELKEAIFETFSYRGTKLEEIVAFEEEFLENVIHQSRWNSFLKKKRAMIQIELADVMRVLKLLLLPVIDSIKENDPFEKKWDPQTLKWN